MNKYIQVAVALLLTFLLLVVADLIPFWMPMMTELMALLAVVVLLLIWVGFVLKEQARDEREVQLTMHSGRIAYLSGLGVLVIALIVQGIQHQIDPWIPVSLAVMVLAKLLTRSILE